jgi:hypothetical protein
LNDAIAHERRRPSTVLVVVLGPEPVIAKVKDECFMETLSPDTLWSPDTINGALSGTKAGSNTTEAGLVNGSGRRARVRCRRHFLLLQQLSPLLSPAISISGC